MTEAKWRTVQSDSTETSVSSPQKSENDLSVLCVLCGKTAACIPAEPHNESHFPLARRKG
jgi:hypothetical protein